MSVIFKFLLSHGGILLLLFLSLTITGTYGGGAAAVAAAKERCSVKDIIVEQTEVIGGSVNGKNKKFRVTLFNACPCLQKNVKLECKGFRSATKIDPKDLIVAKGICSLPVGSSIVPFSGYVFEYDWNVKFQFFKPLSSDVQC